MHKVTQKSVEQAVALTETLNELLEHPTSEIKRAVNVLGVMECLNSLAHTPQKRSECFGLAIDAFVLGAFIGAEQAKLDALYNQTPRQKNGNKPFPNICGQR